MCFFGQVVPFVIWFRKGTNKRGNEEKESTTCPTWHVPVNVGHRGNAMIPKDQLFGEKSYLLKWDEKEYKIY